MKDLKLPLTEKDIKELQAGEQVLISGTLYVARDDAHKRLVEALKKGQKLPFDIDGQVIYYMGPSPSRPGAVIGSAGPTTSGRMDSYTVALLEQGLKGMIGKGSRSNTVRDALRKHQAVYFGTIGGAGALIAQAIKKSKIVAYAELGAEAILKLEVDKLPAVVIDDIYGHDLYEEGKNKYKK